MTIDRDQQTSEPPNATSPTDRSRPELPAHRHRPFQDEPDPRPLPEARTVTSAVADIFDALTATLSETRLEPDLEDLLWPDQATFFHRANEQIERELDENEQAKRSQRDPQMAPRYAWSN